MVASPAVACGFMDNDPARWSASRLEKRASRALASVSGLVMGGVIATLIVIAIYVLKWLMGW